MSLRIPSFFLVVTLKLPGTRFPVPIVLPLFVLDDLLESVDVVMGIMSRVCPRLSKRIQCTTIRCSVSQDKSVLGLEGDLDIRSMLKACSELIKELRSYGRFTLVEVSSESEGVHVTVRLV
ncbi:MAG TPA: hypothetical protein PK192_00220 [Bacillota bacterium]|jgi:hypothetical protein|nr:hypothetical protein [Bacillota bacterium]